MALTRITKGVIKPNENYDTHNINSTGIVTAIGLDVNGNGDISGNLSVGGVLTYEDVTSIDSVGIITAQKDIHVGAGVSAVGVGTFGSLDIGGDIDVDGHTNLDNVSVAGVSTFSDNIKLIDDKQIFVGSGQDLRIGHDSSNTVSFIQNANPLNIQTDDLRLYNFSTADLYLRATTNAGVSLFYDYSNHNTAKLATTATGVTIDGTAVADGLDISGDIDVDGHTELDNVRITGIVTATSATVSGNQILGHGNSTGNQIKFTRSGLGDELIIGTDGYGSSTQYEAVIQSSIVTARPLVFRTNNTERLRIAGGGRVGIGTDNPLSGIHISDGTAYGSPQNSSRKATLTISAGSEGSADIQLLSANYNHIFFGDSADPNTGIIHYEHTGGGTDDMVFSTAGSQRLRIHSNGYMSLGASGAPTKFGIRGNSGTTDATMQIVGNGVSTLLLGQDSDGGVIRGQGGNSVLKFRTGGGGDTAAASGGTEVFRIRGSNFLIGTTASRAIASTHTSRFQIEGTGTDTSSAHIIFNSNSQTGAFLFLGKSRGTSNASNNRAINGDQLGTIAFHGADGTDIQSEGAYIRAQVDGTSGSNDMPGRLVFATTADGSSSATERLRIDSTGKLGLGMTPNTWHTNNQKVFQISGTNAGLNIFTRSGSAHLSSNFIYNSSDAGVFQAASGYAMHHAVSATNGTFDWLSSSAASSSAGSSATMINRLRITQSGNIGINQATPTSILHVKHNNNNSADITIEGGGSGNAGLKFIPGGQTNTYFAYVDTNRNFRIQDHTAERLRIVAGGNILIGDGTTYTPQGLVHLVGDNNSNGPELYLQVGNNNTTDNIGALIFGNNVDKTVCMIRGSTHTANNTGDIEFHTSESGTLSEKLRIKNNGQVNFVRRNQANPFPAGNGTFTGISLDTDGGDIATGRIYIQGYQKNANSDYLTGFNNEGSTLVLYDYANTHYKQKWHKNGGTELYFTTTNRLETTSTGVDITGILDISVTKDTTALIIDGATSGTAYGETGGRIDFKMRNQVNQLTGDPAARVASYLDRGNNGFGLRFSTRYDASTFVDMVQISADYEFEPCLDSTVNLGSEDRTWNNAYIKDMYPDHSNESAMSGNYTAGSWYSTGFYRDNMGGLDTNGTYIVTCFSDTYAAGGGNYSTTTTWIVGVRDQYSNQTQVDSVPRLSTTAHSTNGQYFDLATRRYPSSSYSGREELVWKSTHNMTNINNSGGRLIRFRVQRIGRSST